MAQATDGFNTVDGTVEYSLDGAVWVDISGWLNKLTPGPKTRATGTVLTADGRKVILAGGKQGSIDVEAMFIYTETATEPWEAIEDQYDADGAFYLRWSPKKNAATGDFIFTSDAGIVKELQGPGVDPDESGVFVAKLIMETPYINRTDIPA